MVELGVDALHIFHQANTAKSRLHEKAEQRWSRIVLSAMKQCKRSWLPTIHTYPSLQLALDGLPETLSQRVVLTDDASTPLTCFSPGLTGIAAAVGGERGLLESELTLLINQGFQTAQLGPNILRAKTAAIVTTAILGLSRAGASQVEP
jgi:16S rRNA (uracil1498-N3)-methyltransferase